MLHPARTNNTRLSVVIRGLQVKQSFMFGVTQALQNPLFKVEESPGLLELLCSFKFGRCVAEK